MLSQTLAPLAAWPQFVAWRLEWNAEREKWDKIPYSPITGYGASSTSSAHWGTYGQARAFADANGMSGIGFVFTERDPFFFLDIDKAWDGSKWSMIATELCARLAGVGIEISQSGTGLHLIGRGGFPPEHRNKNIPLGLELYTKERFVALTDISPTGSVDFVVAPDVVASLVETYFHRDPGGMAADWTTAPVPEWSGPADDGELITRAMRSGKQSASSAFTGIAGEPTFSDLFAANADALRAKWPPNTPGGDFDHSSADQSFANMLAFWTGKDCERMERIMRASALARSKWDTHPTYLQQTILKAAGFVRSVYQQGSSTKAMDAAPAAPPPPQEDIVAAGFEPRNGGLMLAHHQMEYFKGCTYISNINKILTPNGDLLDQARFNVEYGGHEFVIAADGKKTTPSAWTAFTENQNYRPVSADKICFRPEAGVGNIIKDSGKKLANTYIPAEREETEGDASPFLNHVKRMLPDGRDAEILLTYMASCIQNPGMKSQWWPVVQGAEGNFKSFLIGIMCLGVGSHYSHTPNMKKMVNGDANFNGWVERKLFLGLDEVYAANRREFFEGFKTTVTNRSIPIEGKGMEEVTGDNRANGMIVTNHQDGVPVIGDNRRYAALFCAQQTREDMKREGMDNAYKRELKDWLLGQGQWAAYGSQYGMRVVVWHLARMELAADIDPNQDAIEPPLTTTTEIARAAGRGRLEQEIMEAIEEDRPGFSGGWVSSMKLEELIDRKRYSIARNKRRDLMISLGYDYHPALGPEGRINTVVGPDNGKPRLYCKVGSIPWTAFTTPAAVATAYADAQLKASGEKTAAAQAFK